MDVPVSYLTVPADVTNQAIDSLGQSGKIVGSLTDGTPVAETARRNYGQLLRQLLRANHWPFARKMAKLSLLGDATGSPPLGVSPYVECPWTYAYQWPIDAVQGRWMPWSPTNAQPTDSSGVPLTTGVSALPWYGMTPGRFLVSSSDQYPVEIGNVPWDQQPDFQRTEGVGPTSRKIILTDCCEAHFVYTRLVTTIEEWDDGFRQAMVALMAVCLAPVAIDDPKEQMAQRNAMIAIAKNTIADARAQSSNEAGYPMVTDHTPDWLTARSSGGWAGGRFGGLGGGGLGAFESGWSSFSFGGSVF